jgi:serine/threonine protein kinase
MKAVKKIKEYYLLNEMGRGTYGKVYEAISEKDFKLYAIKVIPSDLYSEIRA